MCRTVICLVALATFMTASASGAQPPAKSHRKTPVPASAHTTHGRTVQRRAHHAVAAHTKTAAAHKQTQITTHKPTADEAGRSAGLAIRRRLAEQREAGHNSAVHTERSSARLRSESPRVPPPPAIRTSRLNEADAGAREIPAPVTTKTRQPASDRERTPAGEDAIADDARPEASGPAAAHDEDAVVRDSPAAEPDQDRAASSEEAANADDAASAQDGDDPGDAAEASSTGQGAKKHVKAEEASLRMPRGGMPAPLYGTLASLQRQNDRLEAEGLERIEDNDDLEGRIAHKLLVPLPASSGLIVNPNLTADRRYCRPWTALFLADLARAHNTLFHRPIQVNSAVRTVEYQRRLMEINGNAAPAEGDLVSPHLTGATVDIAKERLTRREIAWMRTRLLALQNAGKIDVEEEFHQACFHITVYKSYVPPKPQRPATKARPATKPAGPTAPKRRHSLPAASVAAAVM